MIWEEHAGEIRYQFDENGKRIETEYGSEDLKRVEPPSMPRGEP